MKENKVNPETGRIESKADPLTWLENSDGSVLQWQNNQAELARNVIKLWPNDNYQALAGQVKALSVPSIANQQIPRYIAGKWYWLAEVGIYKADQAFGAAESVQLPEAYSRILWLAPAPGGQYLALGVCLDGSESNSICLLNLATGQFMSNNPNHKLMDNWTGGVCWLPDSSGFYYLALDGGEQDKVQPSTDDKPGPRKSVYFYSLAEGCSHKSSLPSAGDSYIAVTLSPQQHYLVAHSDSMEPQPIAIKDLTVSDPQWQPFITGIDGLVVGHIWSSYFIALTDIAAPNGRVVAIPLAADNPNDHSQWLEIIPESTAVIRSIRPVADTLYLHELVDGYSRIRYFNYEGVLLGEVPLPDKGAMVEGGFPIQNLAPQGHPDEYLFAFSSFGQSCGVYRHRPADGQSLHCLREPQLTLDNLVCEECAAASADGTQVPYQRLYLKGLAAKKAQPTLIYAYGGFNVPLYAQYLGPMLAFLQAGGVYIHAHVRGGGEFGYDWWQGGRQKNKQNSYNDLYAIAEDLIEKAYTTPQQLALTGRSCGGLLSGVAITQRPALWAVVVPQVPRLDLIGSLRDPYGRQSILHDYGDPDDPVDIQRLASFSPYQNIVDGTVYPAVLVTAGEQDPRCHAWHARKFAARLQQANGGDKPILCHIWENAGHGAATPAAIKIQQATEWLAFVMQQLGMTPAASPQTSKASIRERS